MRKIYRRSIIPLCMVIVLILGYSQGLKAQSTGTEVAILDPDLPDVDVLVKNLKSDVKVVYFDRTKSMLSSITQVLSQNAPVSALHVITHGNSGWIVSLTGGINIETIQVSASEINNWKAKFSNGGNILLYGCNIAKGTEGKQFCDKLSQLSGMPVAASSNATGSVSKGGDWNLETQIGNVSSAICFTPSISQYNNLLANVLVYGGQTIDNYGYVSTVSNYYISKGHTALKLVAASTLPDLSTYSLVWVIMPERVFDATEISYLAAHLNKGGRIIFIGEHSGFVLQNNTVTADVLALGGHLSIQSLMLDGGVTYLPNTNMNMSSELMEGVTKLNAAAASAVNIGGDATVLNRSVSDPTKIVMAQERIGNGDIVAWADVNFWDVLSDATYGAAKFFDNLVDKAVLNIQSKSIALLTTTEAYSVGGTTANSGGNITDDKGAAITERGICWSTTNFSPTTSDHKIVGPGTGSGLFAVPITGLTMSTKYYVRAYAINSNGTAYGNTISFTTSSSSNTAPTAVADNFSCEKSMTITGNVMANDFDSDGDAMTAHIVVTPSYMTGSFTLNANGSFSYTHNGNSAAADFFSYYLTDPNGGTSSTVGVSIALFTASNPPVGADGSINVTAGVVYGFSSADFSFTDAGVGHIFNGIRLISAPGKGLLKYNGFNTAENSIYNDITKLTFDNNAQTGGSPFATFTFKVEASSGEESAATYTMTVNLGGGSKTAQTITFGSLPAIKFGDADFDAGATASSGLSVSYASATPSVASIVNGKIRINGVGTSVITASQEGDATYDVAADVMQTLTVGKAAQTISFGSLENAVFGDGDITPGATSSSGLAVVYSSGNTAVVTIVSGKIHIVSSGTAIITASQVGDANYNSAVSVDQSITIDKATQTITFNALSDVNYGKDDYIPGGISSSNLTVTYASDNTSVATIIAGQIHIISTGIANITASQSGDNNFIAADDVTVSLAVNKASLTVYGVNNSKTYGDANPIFTVSYSGFVYEENSSVLTALPTATTTATETSAAGSYAISATGGEADNYSFIYEDGLFTVNKKQLTVTADPKTKTYGDENPELTINYSGFAGEDDATYLSTAPSANTVATSFSNAGIYAIVPGNGIDESYSFNYVNSTLTIDKKDLTATADDKGKSYGDANPSFTITYTGFTNEDDESLIDVAPLAATTAIASSPVKTYPITLSGGMDNNYNILLVNGNLVVNLRNLTITAQDKVKTYGEVNPELTLTYSGFVNGDNETKLAQVPSIATIATATSNAGIYDIALSGGFDEFYTFFFVNASLTINKKELTVVAEDKTKVYGEANPTFTFTYTGFIEGENDQVFETAPVGLTSANQLTGVGTYVVTPGNAVDNNYSFKYEPGNLSITKKDLHVNATDKFKIYGETNPDLTIDYVGYVHEDALLVLPTIPEITTEATSSSDVGTYPITITGGASDNYNLLLANGTLTVDKKELTVTAEPKTKVYGEANPELTFIYDGFVNEDSKSVLTAQPAIAVTATALSGVAVYPITLSGGTAENYTFTLINDNLTITQKDLTVTAVNKYKAVGRPNPTFTFIYAGFVNGETSSALTALPTGSTEASTYTSAGDYDINPVNAASINYNFIYEKGVLRITSIAGDKDGDGKITTPEIAGDEDCDGKITSPELAGDTNGDGGIGSPEIAGDLNGDGKISGGEVNGDTSGDGKITAPELAGDTNGDGTIDGNEIAGDLNGDGTITVNEVAGDTSGDGKITSPEVAGDINGDGTISSPEIIGDISGDKKIDGNEIAGDGNGDSAINSNEVRAIDPAKDHPNVDHLFSPNTDGFNDYWKIPEVEKYGRIQVKIYNRWGGLVYESTNYQNDWNGTSSGKPVPEGAYFYFITSEKEGKKSGVINIVR